MACTGTNWLKRKDIEYMCFMAEQFSRVENIEVGIYEKEIRGVGKIYDFEQVEKGKEYVQIVRFNKQSTSKTVLSDNEGEKLTTSSDTGETEFGSVDGHVDTDSRGLLQGEQSESVSEGLEKSDKNRKFKKRD